VQPLEWTIEDFVYEPQLDADHQKLFADAESLRQAMALGRPVSQIGFQLWRLAKSFSAHLATEERLMRRSRYPACHWHENQHRAGRAKLACLTQAVHRSDDLGAQESFVDFARWMRDHVHLADQMFAAHLRNHDRELIAS
jgi:hemerythrin